MSGDDDDDDDGEMQRVSVRMPTAMVEDLDELEELGIFYSRSEAVREAIARLCVDELERDRR